MKSSVSGLFFWDITVYIFMPIAHCLFNAMTRLRIDTMKSLFNYAAPAAIAVAMFYYAILPAVVNAMTSLNTVANAL